MRQLLIVVLLALPGCVEDQPQEPVGPTGANSDSPRVIDGLQVLYMFQEGAGLDVRDVSGVEPAFDLQLDNLVTNKWLPDGGIEIVAPSVITSPEVAEKVFVACVEANAVTVETWIEPANVTQSAPIFTYSKQGQRNVTLSVGTTRYAGSVLTSTPDPMATDGTTEQTETIQTPTDIATVAAQHVVYTRDATGAAVYVNGVDTKPPSTTTPTTTTPEPIADQTEWSPTYQLVLGNETSGGSPWLGKIYLAAIYCRKLSVAEVAKNYAAGY